MKSLGFGFIDEMRRNYCVWSGEAVKDAYKDVRLSIVFVLLFCSFLGMQINKYLEEEAIDREEEQNQKGRRRKVQKTGKKDGGLVYKGRKSNHDKLNFKNKLNE